MKKIIFPLCIFLIFSAGIAGANDNQSTIFIENIQIMGIGNEATTNITLDDVPNGLSGYNITISLSNPSVANITSVKFPPWATLHSNSTLPSSSVWIKAVDLNKQVEPEDTNIILATISLKSKNIGNSFINISATKIDDDEGYSINATIQNATLNVVVNHPPNKPTNPNPSDDATGVSRAIDLSWTCSDPDEDSITYDVYFGVSTNPLKVSANQTSTTYNPGTLNYETAYYWQIVAWDEHGAKNESHIWHFTTEEYIPSQIWIEKDSTPSAGGYGEAVVGIGSDVFAVRCLYASTEPEFWIYNSNMNAWSNAPTNGLPTGAFRNGACLAYKPDDIFALSGGRYGDTNRTLFYGFYLNGTTWQQLPNTPHAQGAGDALTYCGYDGNLYAFLGSREHGSIFASYNISNDIWQILSSIWNETDDGCSLVWAGNEYLYALQGEIDETTPNNNFARYNMVNHTWEELSSVPETNGVGDGASLLWIGNSNSYYSDCIFALGGGGADESPGYNFYCYYINNNTWQQLEDIPYPVGYYVGNRLAYANNSIYYWQGTPSTWEGGGNKFCQYPLQYVPYVPTEDQVNLECREEYPSSSINVSVTLPTACDVVDDWGTVQRQGNAFYVNTEIFQYTGICIMIMPWPLCHTYDLGLLEEGSYTFVFKAWNEIVKELNFEVSAMPTTVYVDDDFNASTPSWQFDHFDEIQDGVDAVAENGTVYIFNGTYYENVVVNKTINLIGEDRDNTIIDGGRSGNDKDGDGVPDKYDFVPDKDAKIMISLLEFKVIDNCEINPWDTMAEVYFEIYIDDKKVATATPEGKSWWDAAIGEVVRANWNMPIPYNVVDDMRIEDEWHEILIKMYDDDGLLGKDLLDINGHSDSKELLLWYNIRTGKWIGVVEGKETNGSDDGTENTDDNDCYLKFDVLTVGSDGHTPSEMGNVICVTADRVNISGFTVKGAGSLKSGIYLYYVNHCDISDNNISNNPFGLLLDYSSNNTITNNKASNNSVGIYLCSSNNNIISNNNVNLNSEPGILVETSSNNNITENNISYNNCGICFAISSNNNIYLNNFINNSENVDSFASTSIWNSPEQIAYTYNGTTYTNYLGNYWDDYNGSDGDNDGIGDIPYSIDGDKDDYPLMELFENYTIQDITPPEIVNIEANPNQQEVGEWVNISAMVTDNVAVDEVFLNITYPNNSMANFSIKQNKTGDTFYCNKTYNQNGTYYYFIWANDTSGNANSSPKKTFSIFISQYTLTTSVTPSGSGSISLDPSGGVYDAGTVVTATTHANSGYEFSYWSGDASGSSTTIILTMNSNKSIIAHFKSTYHPPPNPPPTANFTYSPEKPTDLESVSFTDLSTDDGSIVNRSWDFGDGNGSYEQNPSHRYADNGTYTVKLKVKDDDGATDTKTRGITVSNVKPTANFTYTPKSPVKVDTTLKFKDNSTDSDGSIANWTWDFDDGTIAYGIQTNHSYNKTGSYNVTLTVTDNDRDTDSYTVTIKVEKEEEEGIPAFEFAFLIIAIAIILIIRRNQK